MDNKEKYKSIPKNLRINTRIVLTSVLAIAIPTVLIIALVITIFSVTSSKINSPTISSASYNAINQLRWNQAASETARVLEKNIEKEQKLEEAKSICKRFESEGALILITENSNEFYCSNADEKSISKMNSALSEQNDSNSYYLGKNGLIITAYVSSNDNLYRFVIMNDRLSFPDFLNEKSESILGTFINRTSIVITGIVLLFIIAIVVISFITTKTIVGPIRQITEGAN